MKLPEIVSGRGTVYIPLVLDGYGNQKLVVAGTTRTVENIPLYGIELPYFVEHRITRKREKLYLWIGDTETTVLAVEGPYPEPRVLVLRRGSGYRIYYWSIYGDTAAILEYDGETVPVLAKTRKQYIDVDKKITYASITSLPYMDTYIYTVRETEKNSLATLILLGVLLWVG